MKRKYYYQISAALLLLVTLTATSWAQPGWRNNSFIPRTWGQETGLVSLINSLPHQDLSAEETEALIKMREEEKLARDVYKVLYDIWGVQIFANISRSEQRHMDAVKALLDKYNLPDPVSDPTAGIFSSQKMQTLYNDLTARGSKSLVDALLVGATIEDLDIYDLKECLSKTDNQDISTVFQNLMKGSRNHLRAFSRMLSLFGQDYTAQFLSQDEVDAIVNSPRERGPVNQDGLPLPGFNRKGCRGLR